MRFHVCTALFFLLICALHAVCYSRVAGKVAKVLRDTRTMLAAGVLFLAVNFLIYLGILQYETMIPTPWPMDLQVYQGGPVAKGDPMTYYNPTYGFWIFFGCCLVLTWISLNNSKNSLSDA
jgi:hypothetical protein